MEDRECKECGKMFNPALKRKGGYIHHCDNCSKEDVDKYLGRVTGEGKGGEIEIFRTNIKKVRAQLAAEARVGPRPCLPVGSPISIQIREGKKEEEE